MEAVSRPKAIGAVGVGYTRTPPSLPLPLPSASPRPLPPGVRTTCARNSWMRWRPPLGWRPLSVARLKAFPRRGPAFRPRGLPSFPSRGRVGVRGPLASAPRRLARSGAPRPRAELAPNGPPPAPVPTRARLRGFAYWYKPPPAYRSPPAMEERSAHRGRGPLREGPLPLGGFPSGGRGARARRPGSAPRPPPVSSLRR